MPAPAAIIETEYGNGRVLKIRGTNSYPTGGYDLPASPGEQPALPPLGINDGQANLPLVAGTKVKFIVQATGLEVANAVDVSAVTLQVLFP